MPFRAPIVACECWARDGLQPIPKVVSTAEVARIVRFYLDEGPRRSCWVRAEAIIGHRLRSNVILAGPVLHTDVPRIHTDPHG